MTWRKVKLGEIVESISVRAKDIDDDYSEFPFLGVSNDTGITLSKYAAEDKAEDYKVIEKGCFAYNPYRVNVGSIALLNEDSKGLISPAYVVFKTKPETIVDELLLKFLKSNEGLRQIKLHARGTVRQALRFEDLCQIELSIPDYETQESIFEKLNSHQTAGDKITAELSHQIELVSGLRQAFLREAMQGKLVPQDDVDEHADVLLEKIKAEKEKLIAEKKIKKQKSLPEIKTEEIPFEIPNNWTWCRFGQIVELSRGRFSVRPRNDPRYFDGAYPFIQIGSLDEKGSVITDFPQTLNEKGLKVSKCFPKGTIVVAIVGGTIANLGVLGIDMCFTDSMVGIFPANYYNQDFILDFLRYKQPEIKSEAYQMAGQPNIKIPTLTNLLLPLPPLAEQKRIVEKLEKLMKFCDELETNIRESANRAEILLQVALKEALEPR